MLLLGAGVESPFGEWVGAVSVSCMVILYLWAWQCYSWATKWVSNKCYFILSTLSSTATTALNGTLVECFGPTKNDPDLRNRVGTRY